MERRSDSLVANVALWIGDASGGYRKGEPDGTSDQLDDLFSHLESGSMQRVLDDPTAEEFTWAPDGRRVAFHSRRAGGWGLWMMAAR